MSRKPDDNRENFHEGGWEVVASAWSGTWLTIRVCGGERDLGLRLGEKEKGEDEKEGGQS